MDFPQTLLGILSLSCALAVASALVARAAARRARAHLRDLQYQMDRLEAEFVGVTVRLKRVEGRQTARLGRDSPARDLNGQPDPQRDPEAWRAWARQQHKPPEKEQH